MATDYYIHPSFTLVKFSMDDGKQIMMGGCEIKSAILIFDNAMMLSRDHLFSYQDMHDRWWCCFRHILVSLIISLYYIMVSSQEQTR